MVGEAAQLLLGVRDPDDRDAVLDAPAREALEDVGRLGVERRGRLVHEQHARLRRERPREAGALRLAAGELAGVAVEEARGQPDALEQLDAAVVVELALGLVEVVAHGPGERHRPLEDHRDLAAQLERIALGDVGAAVADDPLAGHLEAVAEAQERRLARPRRARDDGEPAVGQLGVEAVDAPGLRRADAHGLEREERRHARSIPGDAQLRRSARSEDSMRLGLLLAIVLVLALPSAAVAGTASAGFVEGYKGTGGDPALFYTGAPGERNDIVLIRDSTNIGGIGIVLRDRGATVVAGPGCSAIDERTVRCAGQAGLSALVIDAGDGDDTVTLPADRSLGTERVSVQGGDGADTLTGHGALSGGPGRDVLTGSPLDRDVLAGGAGDDVLRAGAGDDVLTGDGDNTEAGSPDAGGGDDVIDGGAGEDEVRYSGRRRGVRVDLADSAPDGGRGERDRLRDIEDVTGGQGADVLLGDGGANALVGFPGDDRLDGRGGNDSLTGGNGADSLRGGAGNDLLEGRDHSDAFSGGPGDDRLTASNDGGLRRRFECGSGNDRVLGQPLNHFLSDCERVEVGGVKISVRPQRRATAACASPGRATAPSTEAAR